MRWTVVSLKWTYTPNKWNKEVKKKVKEAKKKRSWTRHNATLTKECLHGVHRLFSPASLSVRKYIGRNRKGTCSFLKELTTILKQFKMMVNWLLQKFIIAGDSVLKSTLVLFI